MEEDIKILEDMRDKIYGEIQFVDEFDIEIECQKQFDALNLAINHLRKTRLIKNNYIPKSKVKEKIEEINSELEEKYSAEKISVFSGNTYMEKFKLLGKLQALQELMEDK